MAIKTRITPFLWFDDDAEQAVAFYTSIFPDSRVIRTVRYTAEGAEASGREVGSVMTITFELAGQQFTALNGGPVFAFNEFWLGHLVLGALRDERPRSITTGIVSAKADRSTRSSADG